MKTLRKLAIAAAAAAAGAYSALATPVATARTYSLNGNQPYFDEPSRSALLPTSRNILAGIAPTAVEGAIRGTYGKEDGNGGRTYYENQATSPACLTDGAIPTHEDTSNWNKESNARWLVSDNSSFTWTFQEAQNLAEVRLWTQWADGMRTDIAVSAIKVTTDGETWTTLTNSSFCSGKNTGDAAVQNTITPMLEGTPHFRMVRYFDDSGVLLATGITGLKIEFPAQELGYTCYWEVEASNAVDDPSFVVKNTVNGDTGYTAAGEVAVETMPEMYGYSEYQFTVDTAQLSADGWKAYTPGTVPADVITFELPQTLDADISVTCHLRGTGKTDFTATDTIKSAYGAQPTASVSGGLSVLMGNTYDGALVTAAQLVALSTSTDSHGGIVSATAEDAIVRGDTNLVLTVTNLAGNSATCSVPVTATLAGGQLPHGAFRTLLHLGAIFDTDDLKPGNGIDNDYLANFGGEKYILPRAGLSYSGLDTSDTASTPGTLVWTIATTGSDNWTPVARDNYIKYWHVYIVSPEERDIQFAYASDDDIRVFVNGELQLSSGYNGAKTLVPGHLRMGVNSITIKLREGSGGDFMQLGIQTTDNSAPFFDDLEYRFEPGFMLADAQTGRRFDFLSGNVRLVSLPRLRGYTRYQVYQNNAEGTVEPGENWTEYDPDNLPSATIPYVAPENFGGEVYFTLALSGDGSEEVHTETIAVQTANTIKSVEVTPFGESADISIAAKLLGDAGTVQVKYGADASGLDNTVTLASDGNGTFVGTLDGLDIATEYFYEVSIYEENVRTGVKSGSFTTLDYETYGNCAVVNGSASADGDSAVISFTSNGRIRFSNTVRADILLVGGGGGGGEGGYFGGGGGGAGGVIYQQSVYIAAGQYDVIVGKGGAENMKGADTVFAGRRAFGGGAGNHGFSDANAACDGGSGGGASAVSNYGNRYSGTGIEGMGNDGGKCLRDTLLDDYSKSVIESDVVKNGQGDYTNAGGGGGGAGAPGGGGTYTVGEYKTEGGEKILFTYDYSAGVGGDGIACSITGEALWYGGGGGGGRGGWYGQNFAAAGGKGGGGKGGYVNDTTGGDGEDGANGTGGGGGGGGSRGNPWTHGGRGGDGIVIIRFVQTFADDSKAATGGNTVVKDRANGWMIHTFTEDGTFEIPNSTYVDVLLVGGGGGGGNGYGAGGGGGAGGMLVLEHVTLLAGKHPVTVGAGGRGGIRDREDGEDGGNTVFNGRTAYGGGGGGGIWNGKGRDGGSGGGAFFSEQWQRDNAGGAGIAGQGHDGGSNTFAGTKDGDNVTYENSDFFGAGGGGAGEAGASASNDGPGKGGDGLMCDFSGEEKWYAGGGAGGGNANVSWTIAADGGKGGGGKSGHWPNGTSTTYESDNEAFVGHAENGTGGGGGGGARWGNGNNQGPGGNGGSGIVIIRYKLRRTAFTVKIR